MARLIVHDEKQIITFNEGALPSCGELLRMYPSRLGPSLPTHAMPSDSEQQAAWLLTMHAHQIAAKRGYDRHTQPSLETWVIGEPVSTDASLTDWFEGRPETYRLLVHRSPIQTPGSRAAAKFPHLCWERTYDRIKLKRRYTPGSELTRPVFDLLERVHHAYLTDESSLDSIFESTGHAYARSRGAYD